MDNHAKIRAISTPVDVDIEGTKNTEIIYKSTSGRIGEYFRGYSVD